MGLFNKIFKKKTVLEQNLDENDKVVPGMIFTMQLLFEEPCEMPDKDFMTSVMKKHLGEIENYSYDEKMAGFAAKKYLAEFSDAKVPPLLSVMACDEFDASKIGVLERSNMWNCKNSEELLESCKYQVFATDMMAVYFQNCGKLSQEVMWKCQYEQALIQPVREVIDICMNEYAAGGR